MSPLRATSARDRRAVRLGSLVLAAGLAYAVVVRPYVSALSDVRERTRIERDLFERERSLITEASGFPDRMRSAEAAVETLGPRLLPGDPSVAAGVMVAYLVERAESSRVFVQSSESRAPEQAGPGLVSVRVEMRAASDLRGLLAFLAAVEQGPKLVHLERLAIERGPEMRSVNGDLRSSEVQVVTIHATLSGYAPAPPEET